jgi:O-antigen/teichoic acid export membrane protein
MVTFSATALRRIRTASTVVFSQGFVAGAFFVQTVLAARMMSLEQFGVLSATLAIAAVAEASINARASETALSVFSACSDVSAHDRERLVRRLLRIDLAWNTAAYALLTLGVLLYDVVEGTSSGLLLILLAGGFVSFPWGTAKGYITVFLSARKFAPAEVAYAATALIGSVVLTHFYGIHGFAVGMTAASVARTIAGLWVIGFNPLRRFSAPAPGADRFDRRQLWWFGATGTLRSVLLNGVQQIDVLILAALANPASVALYRAARTLSFVPQKLSLPVWVVLKRQIIFKPAARPARRWSDPVLMTAAAFLGLGLLAMPLLILYANRGMAFVFGAEFAPAGRLLLWLLPGMWIMHGVTGWAALFGSISRRRITVIAIYGTQLGVIAATTGVAGAGSETMAIAVSLANVLAAMWFWLLYFRQPADDVNRSAERQASAPL